VIISIVAQVEFISGDAIFLCFTFSLMTVGIIRADSVHIETYPS
jgi:hypothetical protein